jgi:hypothetical protein
MIQKITILNAGADTSNGVYIKINDDLFLCENNQNFIEKTIDGWILIDKFLDEQTYMFDDKFESVISVGDCIEPIPNFFIN